MLRDLAFPRAGRRSRSSSWDRRGANDDHVVVEPGGTHALLDVGGPGMVTHIWITVNTENPTYLRDVVLEMTWDGAAHPAVVAPLGDFFALGHARMASVTSLPITVVAGGASGRCRVAPPCATLTSRTRASLRGPQSLCWGR